MKLRLLFCSEASILSTGYAVYAHEMLSRLHKHPNIEVVEYAKYVFDNDERLKDVPWKVVGVLPNPNNKQETAEYNQDNPYYVFGGWKFDKLVSDFRPHVVFDYNDEWAQAYQTSSPLRDYYHLVWMPTVDAYPQSKKWLASFANCDTLFTYTDWAANILRLQSGGQLNPITTLAPSASTKYQPVESKLEHKKRYGLENFRIIGTVMRNQKRKLFPELFASIRQLIDKTGWNNILLYCHTSYPDKHPWDIPSLINEFGLASKILMTYSCQECLYTFPAFFNDFAMVCPRCHQVKATTSNVNRGATTEFMNDIYNLMDVYVQYANSEGIGIPQLEAASCALPVITVNYSGMCDIVEKIEAIPINVKAFTRELETGCYRAIPDNDHLIELLTNFFKLSTPLQRQLGFKMKNNYEKHFGYDKISQKFINFLMSLNVQELEDKWHRPLNVFHPPRSLPQQELNNNDFALWLIANVLGQPDKIGTYLNSRLLKDLNYGYTDGSMYGTYMNDNSFSFVESKPKPIDRQQLFEHFCSLRHAINYYEELRWKQNNEKK